MISLGQTLTSGNRKIPTIKLLRGLKLFRLVRYHFETSIEKSFSESVGIFSVDE